MSSPTGYREDSSGQDTFGPSLPPTIKDNCSDVFGPSLPRDMIGPSLPTSDTFGPSLPKDLVGPSLPKEVIGPSLPTSDTFGPSLPKDLVGPKSDTFGPSLPPGHTYGQSDTFGPLPPDESGHTTSSSPSLNQEDDLVGPLPPQPNTSLDEESEKSTRKQEIEARANQMRSKLKSKNIPSQPVREEWMLELPPEINPNATALSMTSRKFRTKYSETGDRSVWTDTPAEKARKAAEERQKMKKKEEEIDSISKRDQKLAEEIDQYNKRNRGESLVDLHRKRKAEV
ncbi:PREDICTED: GPALPP motifs-containing protein 1-like isoform X2 [Amphimedon queenslandica]|uniref:DUF3752 domain-containing protein n=1 Tax=Amphimedon queenslandica TaxID=400682 RepID=A0AAN0J1C4_AMPQE|nr:PREDICTED: GPALPP motifs-containing protein 1-like isoform X2 [Amphimedon queenslandica]|eukprot:XP_019850538.1 PREDICTED: GPALPP motifs-containing protein 1-like isoform X2 [Amphimedon queenslandica]